MKKICFLLVLVLFISNFELSSQQKTIRVFFRDKGPYKFEKGTILYLNTIKSLSEKSIIRRMKTLGADNFVNYGDAPIYTNYLDKINALGAQTLLVLKWRNYAVFRCDSSIINKIKKLEFVNYVQFTGSKLKQLGEFSDSLKKIEFKLSSLYLPDYFPSEKQPYGNSYNQVHSMNADKLHKLGIMGDSVIISIMDSGFNWKKHNSLKEANVIYEHDFLQNDSETNDSKDDIAGQHGHGTLVFSSIGGCASGELIGISPNSEFIICKTESIPLEIHLEEDNFAAALEKAEALGADISSSSLAYLRFNDTDDNYTFDEFDGHSTISAIAINQAVARGMVCITAAGNTGPNPKTLLTPGDADSAITVGAVKIVDDSISIAGFSSRGPNADSVIKPDLTALGVKVACANPGDSDKYITANGTSLATPLVSGAAALMLSCFPELRTWEVRDLLFKSCSKYPNKNNEQGYGLLNIWDALENAGTIISPPFIYFNDDFIRVVCHVVPKGELLSAPRLFVKIKDKEIGFDMIKDYHDFRYIYDLPKELISNNNSNCFIEVKTGNETRRYPYNKEQFFSLENHNLGNNSRSMVEDINQFDKADGINIEPKVVKSESNFNKVRFKNHNRGNISISVISSSGRNVYSEYMSNRDRGIVETKIITNDFPTGIYFIRINENNKNRMCWFVKI